MKKYFLLLIILVSFFYLSQNANANCAQSCALHTSEPDDSKECYTLNNPEYRVVMISDSWSCSVNEKTSWEPRTPGYYYMVDNCAKGKNVCLKNACPSISYPDLYVKDGDPCTVKVSCSDGIGSCANKVLTGVWDASESKCITCNTGFLLPKSEEALIAKGSDYYVYVYNQADGLRQQIAGDSCLSGTTVVSKSGDAQFESACGADTACDEKVKDAICTTTDGMSGKCDNYGKCIVGGCTPCDSGATPCGSCSAASPGYRCNDDNMDNQGELEYDDECKSCAKYSLFDGRYTGVLSNPDIPEVCLDSYDDATGKYAGYKVDEYYKGSQINEASCKYDWTLKKLKCGQAGMTCKSGELGKKDASLITKWRKDVPAIPANTYSFYCDSEVGLPPKCKFNDRKDGSETGIDCGGNDCPACDSPNPNDCDPGNPPYQNDGDADCAKCGCPPSEYKPECYAGCGTTLCTAGSKISCLDDGKCGYSAPPGLTGEVPECISNGQQDNEYNITYTMKTLYLLAGKSAGGFSGYNWSLSKIKWEADGKIQSGASVSSYSSPAILLNNTDTYLVVGRGDGGFSGFNWTGTGWITYSGATAGLTDIGDNSKPSIFYKDNRWHAIAGNNTGRFTGFSLANTGWVSNASLIAGLTDVGSNSAPAVFFMAGTMFLMAGNDTGKFTGYNWSGSAWQSDSNITGGLSSAGSYSSPYVFYKDGALYLITGKADGLFSGYNWSGSAWQSDSNITGGLTDAGDNSAPAIFQIDSSYTKTFKYQTMFSINGMQEYPKAGSQCFQNKTEIIIPEGHACLVNIYANTTHGWGVRLKSTIYPEKTLQQDPYNVCGYIGEDMYNYCQPLGKAGTDKCCPANLTPALQAGTYEFGIVSSTSVANSKVSKGCAYITQCSDCTNPYAQYYCDLCTNDRCKDKIQNCAETGVDCGGPCQSGKETDNSYVPTISYAEPAGLWGTKLYTEYKGLNCVDGIDNNNNCLTDCADPDCADSIICSLNEPPLVEIKGIPKEPCKSEMSGWPTCGADLKKPCKNPSGDWNVSSQMDCSAYPEIKCTPMIAEYKCKESSFGYKVYESDPGKCPGSDLEDKTKAKGEYKIKAAPTITDTAWVCGYAEDLSGNANVSAPVKFSVNKTFSVTANARAYQFEGKAIPNSEVNVYLCGSGAYYCNQDAQYMAKVSGKTDSSGKFNLEIKTRLERGLKYKIGVQTEKGYAESEFTA